ncbi:MAG: ATP-binding protein [Gammaproteobacteria bacterium]
MAADALKRRAVALGSVGLLTVSLLGSLILMSGAIQNSDKFGALFSILLLTNSIGLLAFVILIGINVRRLIQQLRARQHGARLTLRMLIIFVVLAVVPVLVLYGFSLDFLRRGIDSWFDVRIDDAMVASLDLGREALDVRMRQLLVLTERMGDELAQGPSQRATFSLDALRSPNSIVIGSRWVPGSAQLDVMRGRSGAEELLLLSADGKLLASSTDTGDLLPQLPPESVLIQVRQGSSYINLDPIRPGDLAVRVAVPVVSGRDRRILQAIYPFSSRINELAGMVEASYAQYNELAYLRDKLKLSFAMTLTLVLLFSIVTAVWAAFYSARRMAAPIRDLAEGTAAVAAGDYTTNLPVASNDDIGFLVRSFNDMTIRVASARSEVETQREYLDRVLRQLSSGVITLSAEGELTTINDAAVQLLEISVAPSVGHQFLEVCGEHEHLSPFTEAISELMVSRAEQWQQQVTLLATDGRREVMCRGSSLNLSDEISDGGYVLVLEDITAIIRGQRDAAWSEVARRLAHEIKNPLTPIQLAAERLRLKYLRKLGEEDGATLERLTNTIIQQVETMKGMVNTFSDYAKAPAMIKDRLDINEILAGIVELFAGTDQQAQIETHYAESLPPVSADPARIRQVFNNLIKNALEASPEGTNPHIIVSTKVANQALAEHVEIRIEDHGSGVADELLANIFEPYVTNKSRGTGLGLAIVKKIVEEHDGMVTIRNRPKGGAIACVRLPADLENTSAMEKAEQRRGIA